jgi:hypothetical protein
MCRKHHLILVTPFLGAGLILGGAAAAQTSILPGSAKTAVGDFSQRTDSHDSEPSTETQYNIGYREGYGVGIMDGRNSCKVNRRQMPGTANYLLGWAVGYNAGYSVQCPDSSKPRFRLSRPHTE